MDVRNQTKYADKNATKEVAIAFHKSSVKTEERPRSQQMWGESIQY